MVNSQNANKIMKRCVNLAQLGHIVDVARVAKLMEEALDAIHLCRVDRIRLRPAVGEVKPEETYYSKCQITLYLLNL